MKLIEVAFVLGHGLVALPGFGNHHHHGMCQAAAGKDEELEAIIEFLRVGSVFANDGKQLL